MRSIAIAVGCVVVAGCALTVAVPRTVVIGGENTIGTTSPVVATSTNTPATPKPLVTHVEMPVVVRGIYMSQCVVGTKPFREKLVKLIDDTPINTVVIDIKDYTGKIAFDTDNPKLADSVSTACGARDMREFINTLHEKGIYVMGRVTVFQDPYYTKLHPEQAVQSAKINPGKPWKDFKGLSFIDVSSRAYWDYVVELSRVAHDEFGFDEINYDYIRYPSDGPMSDARYVNPNKAEAVETFWKYLEEHVRPLGVRMSADVFGMTTTNSDDLNIGQQLERALPHFDAVMPMVYPSHYPKNFRDLGNPNFAPYDVVHISLKTAAERAEATSTVVKTLEGSPIASTSPQLYTKAVYPRTKLRAWLQDFDYGKDYTTEDIAAQIKAVKDAGTPSYVFWDPANRYDNVRGYFASGGVE